MRVVHQFAPPMSALIASLPGVTSVEHMPTGDRWNLPVDADVLFVVQGEGKLKAVDGVPRPAGWPGATITRIGCSMRRGWPVLRARRRGRSPSM
ncbi:MAG: hypothetical protein EBY28_01795 [Betaproteobacteria bacterium]|nr:hypothetical protein [Betaproteobacteria bacterium]